MLVLLCSSSALALEDRREAEEAASSYQLAQALLDKGDLDAALDAARRALALQQRVYGPEHLETAYYNALVGQILYKRGDLEGAFDATRRALDIHERGLGYDHPDSAAILSLLATILNKRGDLEGALQYQRRALKIYETSSGPDNTNAIQALANLGTTLFQKGDLKEALEVTREALRRDQKLFGPDHLRVAQRYRNLARIQLKLGDLEDALQNTRRALQIFQRNLEADDPEIGITASNLGVVFEEKGDLPTAFRFYRRALQIEERRYGPNHSNVAVRLNNLASVLLEQGDLQGARNAAQRALRIDENLSGLAEPSVARDSDTLARILLGQGDLKGALEASQRALSIDEVAYGANHPDVARDSATLSAILLAKGDRDGALRAAQRALGIAKKNFGSDIPEVARYARGVGLVLQKQGNAKEARRYFEQAHRVFAAKYGLDHPMTRKTAQDLKAVSGGLGLSRTALLAIAAGAVTIIALVLLVLFLRERRTLAHTLALSKTAPPPGQAVVEEPSTAAEGPNRIGPYRLEERLGEGGMGVVYRAYDERLERWVAVKLIPPDKSRDPHRRERLRREAQASARLSHPAIIQVHDFVHTEHADGIVMELVEGELLTRLLWSGPLDLQRALPVARDIAEAMAEAHSKGIIHRDLKSENVIITPRGRAKILDFGIAKRLDRSEPALTTEGAVIGTYRTMAPEQAQGQEVDHRADLFALGTLYYEMFTGKSPFLGSSAADTMWRICCHRQQPAREVNSNLPEELSELIDWLLQKEPQHRPRDAREVVTVLVGLVGSGPPSSSTEPVRVPLPEASTFLEAPLLEKPLSIRDPESS